jgi:hypothetical protein
MGRINGAGAELSDAAAIELFQQTFDEIANTGSSTRIDEVEAAIAAPLSVPVKAQLANLVAHHHFRKGRYADALEACRRWASLDPDSTTAKDSLLSILIRLGRFDEVISEARMRLAGEPLNFSLRASLGNAMGKTGRLDEARGFGLECLDLKDRSATQKPFDISAVMVPPFDPTVRQRNVIAFSLFGSKEQYCEGAIRNAVAAHFLYPEWTCRFYTDESVPAEVTMRLHQEGAQIKRVGGLPAGRFGTFWRFMVADDSGVDRYLVRDCDACLNLRERTAVEDWIASGRHFHVMRDGYTHTELILAGMWGGVRGALPPVTEAIVDYGNAGPLGRTADQNFLRERIWPTVRRSAHIHDSFFRFGQAIDFPPAARPKSPVGQAVTTPKVR